MGSTDTEMDEKVNENTRQKKQYASSRTMK